MQLFHHSSAGTIDVVIDIGSASVLTAYVLTPQEGALPEVLWSHREHIPLRTNASADQLAKNLLLALMNSAIALETTGRKVLEATVPRHTPEPTELFVSVSAPWSYTVSKTISYVADEPFSLTNDLLHELTHTAESKTTEELKEQETAHTLGLSVTSRTTAAILANSYPVKQAAGQKATTVAVSQISGVVQSFLVDALHELRDKTFPQAKLRIHPFMVSYFEVVRALVPESTEVALIDITYEATEIGIVRDGVLQYCTHAAYGAYSLARDLATEKKITPEEALGQLCHPDELSGEESESINTHYDAILADIFKETGDRLSVPKTVYIHCPGGLDAFLGRRLLEAGKLATSGELFITPLTKEISTRIAMAPIHDSALLVSLWFFHIRKSQTQHTWI